MAHSSHPRNNNGKPAPTGGPRKRSYRRSNTNQTIAPPSDTTMIISVDADINLLEQTNARPHAKPTDKLGEIEVKWAHNASGAVVGPLFYQETEEETGSPVRVIDISIPVAGGRNQSATKLVPVLTLFVNKLTGLCQIDEGDDIPKGLGSTHGWTLTLRVERVTGGARV